MLLIKFFLIIACFFVHLLPMGELYQIEKPRAHGLALLGSDLELRQTQRTNLEKEISTLKKRTDDTFKIFSNTLSKISKELGEAQQKGKDASESETDFLNKKIIILNDRKQNFFDYQELWKERLDIGDRHIKLLDETIEYLRLSSPNLKPAYSWKEFRDAQIRFIENSVKLQNDKNKRNNIKKQKSAALERLSSWEKQRDVKNKEHENLLWNNEGPDKKSRSDSTAFKQESEVIVHELSTLNEKIDVTKLLIEKLDVEGKYWDDLIDFEKIKMSEQKDQLAHIEAHLVLDYKDIEIAKAEWKTENQKALAIKDEINQNREPKKQIREKHILNLEVLQQRLAELKQKGVKNQSNYILVKTQARTLEALVQACDKELALLDAKKELADVLANEKALQFNMIELRYKLKIESENFEVLLSTFQNKKDLAISLLKGLNDKKTEAITSLNETNRAIEKVKTTREKLKVTKTVLTRLQDNQVRSIFSLLDENILYFTWARDYIQSYLAINSEIIAHQEKIVNQYDLIINDLEHRHKIYNIWKRSPKAISLDALWRATLEAETFFKQLYWETPSHIKLSSIITFLKGFGFYEFLMLILFLLFYLFSFLACRALLRVTKKRCEFFIERYQGHTRYLYLYLALAIINFALNNFNLLFSWLFLFLHVIYRNGYIFSTLRPFISNYSIAIFYLASVPILLYLASEFIENLKGINRQLSYFFFTETLQDKFIVLVSIFCYSTAILLPLRASLLAYAETTTSAFATVILAGYTLILVVVLMLLLDKENVLRFIPAYTTVLIWIKRKIDKNYYPVFLFLMGLLILANSYVGYSSMAWFLAFAVPSSVLLCYALLLVHFYIRKYAIFIFMKEEDDEIIDKFEHAKAYYGFFIIFSFLALSFITFMLVLRIWGITYTPLDIWKALSEDWVIRIGVDNKIGLLAFLELGLFVTVGFIISSFLHKFVLSRLFDILRSEPGTQNTISRILHYTIVFIAVVLGLYAIHLQEFMFWVAAPFGIVLGLALKDIVSDYLAGFFVLIERPIEIGNFIQIDAVQGTVHKIAARSTTIITSRNHSVIIPNKDLISKWIFNWGHGRFAVGFEINIRVEHASDPDAVKKILLGIIQSNSFVLKVPGIVIRLEDIEENALYFLVRAFISARRVKEQWDIAAVLRTEIIKAFRDQNITLAKPARVVEFSAVESREKKPGAIEIKFDH